ncbi:ABC transporter ATP-binding protein/permease [Saccharopolyspora sp. K220]|uniref:ABC transporter transmembrane domain-containing protein n=1 Tax=Saccharopolyspora soli TaxID=2926618 RepID=UPI001F573331|nr:ABC transporter ATP-binding protein [Saccharopolyspora soli]MCI2423722.1 ABC transporter ATP-binding protein/permease [Saccharopolyspora soli]
MQANTRLVFGTVGSTGLAGIGMFFVAIVDPATRLALPAALAAAVDSAIDGELESSALTVLGAVLGIATLGEAAREYLETRTSALGALFLRRRLLRHVFALGVDGQRRFGAGDVLNRVLESTEVTASSTSVLVTLVTSLITSVGGLIALFLIDPSLALLFLVAAPLLWWLTRWLIRRVGSMTNEYQRLHSQLSNRFIDAVRGARTIRASGTVEQEVDRVLAPLPALSVVGLDFWEAQRKATWQAGLFIPVLQISVLAAAGIGVVHGRVTPGELIAAQAYLVQAMGLLNQTAILARFAQSLGAAKRVQDVLGLPPPRSGSRRLPNGRGQVSLRSVRVHKDQRPILDGLDLDVPAGRAVAVVGTDGAAKAALAEVAGGLVTPDEGTVLLDGVPLAELAPDDVRKAMSYAFERPKLLGETVEDALAYSDTPPGSQRVEAALRTCAAIDFVQRLPMKRRTPLAELRLSGGELQRLGLARAAARDARVVVLSDPMSSVDTATEVQITTALNRAWQGTTRIIVAHRMSTAARADLVAWLHKGVVRACGTHEQLLSFPDYRAVFQIQRSRRTQPAGERVRDPELTQEMPLVDDVATTIELWRIA